MIRIASGREDKVLFICVMQELTLLSWLLYVGRPTTVESLGRLLGDLKQRTRWHPYESIKTTILAIPPVIKEVEYLSNLDLGWVLPLECLWNTFVSYPGAWILYQRSPWNDLLFLTGLKA
jgi:hypothetical protein